MDLSLFPVAKSIANRFLILTSMESRDSLESYAQKLEEHLPLPQDTDVLLKALRSFFAGQSSFHLGSGGSSFRFFSLFLSRYPGHYEIEISEQLAQRPHEELKEALRAVDTEIKTPTSKTFGFAVKGWPKESIKMNVRLNRSSQSLSALLLASVGYTHPISLEWAEDSAVSKDFIDLSLQCLGLEECFPATQSQWNFHAPKHFSFSKTQIDSLELDAGALLPFWAWSALQKAELPERDSFQNSPQPDALALQFFQTLQEALDPAEAQSFSLEDAPDIAPVFASFLALRGGIYELNGLSHLIHKESNRADKIIELLQITGAQCEWNGKRLRIESAGVETLCTSWKNETAFNPAEDHRMVFAAALLKKAGLPLRIENQDCVAKSFPNFCKAWEQA